MIKKLQSLFQRKDPSIVDALLRFIDGKKLDEIVIDCPDRRLLIDVAAQHLGITSTDLALNVARVLRFPFVEDIPPIDIRILPTECNIAKYRKLGAIPVIKSGNITGIICVDPVTINPLAQNRKDFNIYISLWSNIAKAIDTSEELYKSNGAAAKEIASSYSPQHSGDELASSAHRVLAMLIGEVESYKQSNALIRFLPNEIIYEFMTLDRRRAKGSMNVSVKEKLVELLESIADRGPYEFRLKGGGARTIYARVMKNGFLEIGLVWNSDPIKNNHIPQKSSAKVVSFPQDGAKNLETMEAAPTKNSAQILIVDDNDTFAAVLTRYFARKNMRVIRFPNGDEAWKALDSGEISPDLIICDVHMPGMNGFRFLDQVRKDPRHKDAPIIMITTDTAVETEIKLITDGADAFVAKNEDPRILCAHADRLIMKRTRQVAA